MQNGSVREAVRWVGQLFYAARSGRSSGSVWKFRIPSPPSAEYTADRFLHRRLRSGCPEDPQPRIMNSANPKHPYIILGLGSRIGRNGACGTPPPAAPEPAGRCRCDTTTNTFQELGPIDSGRAGRKTAGVRTSGAYSDSSEPIPCRFRLPCISTPAAPPIFPHGYLCINRFK